MPYFTIFRRVSLYLSILGAFNWGLVGIADFNLFRDLFPAACGVE